MPRPRVRVELWHADPARLQQAIDYIAARLPAANKFYDKPFDWVKSRATGLDGPTACWDGRLKDDVDAKAIWSTLQGYAETLRTNGFRARLSYHLCSHDDPEVTACVTNEVRI